MENNLNDEKFTSFLACQKWKIYLKTGKMVSATQNC